MPRGKPPLASPNSTSAASNPRSFRVDMAGSQAAMAIPRALAYLALVGLAVLFLWLTLRVDLVIFGGVLFAISLRRTAEALSRMTGLPVGWSLLAVVLLASAFLSAIGWFFSQAIAGQINQLSQQLPAAAEKVANMISQSSLGQTVMQHVNTTSLQTSATNMLQSFFGVAVNVAEVVGGIVVIVFLALYLAAESGRYAAGVVQLVAPAGRERALEILHETASAIWFWMLGRLFSMTVLGVLTALGLWLLGVPLAAALGFLAGIMIFVPYIGSIASAIPAVIIAASIDLMLAVCVIALYLGVHLVEGYILVPLVQRRAVHLPPALTLSMQVILGVLAGFLGVLFATPLVAAGLVMVRMIYVEGILGDRGGEPAPLTERGELE